MAKLYAEEKFITEEMMAKLLYVDDKPLPGTIIKEMKYTSPPSPAVPKGLTAEQHASLQAHIAKGADVTVDYSGGVVSNITVEYDYPSMTMMGGGMMGPPGSYIYDESSNTLNHKNYGGGLSMNIPEKYGEWKDHSRLSPPTTTIEVLDRAEAAIDELGWIKGALHGKEGVCMRGALDLVSGGLLNEQASSALLAAIKNNMLFDVADSDLASEDDVTIPEFNDSENTTLEQVKLAFKHARHGLESE